MAKPTLAEKDHTPIKLLNQPNTTLKHNPVEITDQFQPKSRSIPLLSVSNPHIGLPLVKYGTISYVNYMYTSCKPFIQLPCNPLNHNNRIFEVESRFFSEQDTIGIRGGARGGDSFIGGWVFQNLSGDCDYCAGFYTNHALIDTG